MSEKFIPPAAATMLEIVRNIKPDQLTAPTPCAEFDVRKLVNHLLFWGQLLVGAARKESVEAPAESESAIDLTEGDWASALEAHVEAVVTAWSDPAAWQGKTGTGGGPMEMPAEMVGGMVLGELLMHGWDLARATGQRPTWDEGLVEYVHGEIARSADQGRQMGVYGPEVTVPDGASTLDKALALSGRDPAWTP